MSEQLTKNVGPDAEPAREGARRSNVSAMLASVAKVTDQADADDALWRDAAKDFDAQRPHRPLLTGLY